MKGVYFRQESNIGVGTSNRELKLGLVISICFVVGVGFLEVTFCHHFVVGNKVSRPINIDVMYIQPSIEVFII